MRSCYKAVNWYFEHLGGQKPLIIITENQEFIQDFKNKRLEIFVTSLGDYLQQVINHVIIEGWILIYFDDIIVFVNKNELSASDELLGSSF